MSVGIKIENAVKKYGENTVIPGLNLNIKPGEFFTLLGPSGCGKTTLLRMIAGFNSIEAGTIRFDDKIINDLEPGKRNIGMVFQNYAIFPHMTVRKNVEFGLKMRGIPASEIHRRAEKSMALMHITEFADRMPDRMSGGQQQRVALARALVIEPAVLLMDEPLSNLDAKLRVEMRKVIKKIQHDVGITNVYVTHDQEEAMAVSDRIALMKDGVIQQVDRPRMLYQRPANTFVAGFIGRSNFLAGHLRIKNGQCILEISDIEYPILNLRPDALYEQDVIVSVRPEEFIPSAGDGLSAEVTDSVFLGLNTHYNLQIQGQTAQEETGFEMIQESSAAGERVLEGSVKLNLNLQKINIFSKDGRENLIQTDKEVWDEN